MPASAYRKLKKWRSYLTRYAGAAGHQGKRLDVQRAGGNINDRVFGLDWRPKSTIELNRGPEDGTLLFENTVRRNVS